MAKKTLKKKEVKKETEEKISMEDKDQTIVGGGYTPKEGEDVCIQPNIITEE